jgi:ubiquinone/menaquinone biosynthesis C-methylase UbiE
MLSKPNHKMIYLEEAALYEEMISFEDAGGHFRGALLGAADWEEKSVVDLGAGTGRISRLIASQASSIALLDKSPHMAEASLQAAGWGGKCSFHVADHRELPLPDCSADIIAAGWTICYLAAADSAGWEERLRLIMREIERVLRPGGDIIIMETLGTGCSEPDPPSFLKPYFTELEKTYGFARRSVTSSFRFPSACDAERLVRFFFGAELADRTARLQTNIVPSHTGIWTNKAPLF